MLFVRIVPIAYFYFSVRYKRRKTETILSAGERQGSLQEVGIPPQSENNKVHGRISPFQESLVDAVLPGAVRKSAPQLRSLPGRCPLGGAVSSARSTVLTCR